LFIRLEIIVFRGSLKHTTQAVGSDAKLLNYERYDEYYLSGYGISSAIGIILNFINILFIQPEFKGGFMNKPDVRTTSSATDRGSQSFLFSQFNAVFGSMINLNRKTRATKKNA